VRLTQILLSHARHTALNIRTTRLSFFSSPSRNAQEFQWRKNQLSSPSCSRRKECRRDGIDPRVTTVSAKRAKEKKNILSRLFGQDVQHQIRHVSQKSFVLRSTPRFTVNLPSPPSQRKKTGHSIISVRVRVFFPAIYNFSFKKSALMMQLSHQTVADMVDSFNRRSYCFSR
jgi:hypothetical protein